MKVEARRPQGVKGYDTQVHPENLTEQSFYWRDLHANTFMSLSCKFVTSQSFCRSFDLEEGPVRVPKRRGSCPDPSQHEPHSYHLC